MKQERNAWLAPWLSELLVQADEARFAQLPSSTWVVPVPLHWWRRVRRGYNQAEGLAEGIAQQLGLELHHPLRRVKHAGHLAGKNITERMEAMHGAFRVRQNSRLKGRTILLVDDILTTGATCGTAARVLKQAGVKRVVATVIARTN
jgi:ComF family protein